MTRLNKLIETIYLDVVYRMIYAIYRARVPRSDRSREHVILSLVEVKY